MASKVKVKYKGPSVHRRVLTRKDLEKADVEFPENVTVKEMVWEAGNRRRAVDITGLGDSAKEFFENQALFEVVEDGEVTSEAHPDADKVNADGSSKAETEGDGLDHSGEPGSEPRPKTSHTAASRTSTRPS